MEKLDLCKSYIEKFHTNKCLVPVGASELARHTGNKTTHIPHEIFSDGEKNTCSEMSLGETKNC